MKALNQFLLKDNYTIYCTQIDTTHLLASTLHLFIHHSQLSWNHDTFSQYNENYMADLLLQSVAIRVILKDLMHFFQHHLHGVALDAVAHFHS